MTDAGDPDEELCGCGSGKHKDICTEQGHVAAGRLAKRRPVPVRTPDPRTYARPSYGRRLPKPPPVRKPPSDRDLDVIARTACPLCKSKRTQWCVYMSDPPYPQPARKGTPTVQLHQDRIYKYESILGQQRRKEELQKIPKPSREHMAVRRALGQWDTNEYHQLRDWLRSHGSILWKGTTMKVACSRGCGGFIEVPMEQIEEMMKLGGAVAVGHEVCPTEPDAPQHKYRFIIQVFKDDEQVAGMGGEVEAGTFRQAIPALNSDLEAQWRQVTGLADTIDEEPVEAPCSEPRCKGCGVIESQEVLDQLEGYHSSECARDNKNT